MDTIPIHPDEITSGWLSDLLDTEIEQVTWQPIGTGQVGDSVRFALEGPQVGHDAPGTLAGKFPSSDATSRQTAGMFGLYRKEVLFYREIAPLLEVRVPQVHFAATSADGQEFCLIFEDLGPARQGNQIAGCSIEDARHAIMQAAAIHAPSWGRSEIIEADWIVPSPAVSEQVALMYPQAHGLFRERYKGILEAEFMAVCDQFAEVNAIARPDSCPPPCLPHGDVRLDNLLFDIRGGEEPIAVLDWQTLTPGNAMTDVGYFMGCGIGQLGLDHEDELLDLYFSEMKRRGVGLSREEAYGDYRRGILHGLSTAVFSAAFVQRTERGDANFLSMARGACALALRHDSIGALEEA